MKAETSAAYDNKVEMKKKIAIILLTLLILGCVKKHTPSDEVSNNEVPVYEESVVETVVESPIVNEVDNYVIQEGISYTREELDQKLNRDKLIPIGIYFWDEFPSLQGQYGLGKRESELLGRWDGYDIEARKNGNQSKRYLFYPNNLFVLDFMYVNYYLKGGQNKYLYKAVGVWYVRDNKVYAQLYFIITSVLEQQVYEELLLTQPYEIEIIDLRYIDPAGYSRVPFNSFEVSSELEEIIDVPEYVDDDYQMVRKVHSFDIFNLSKYYLYLELVPEMAELGISGMDIINDPELFKKYVLDIWP